MTPGEFPARWIVRVAMSGMFFALGYAAVPRATSAPEQVDCPVPNAAFLDTVERQLACDFNACEATFRSWCRSTQYPCDIQRAERFECAAALERKCPSERGALSDCQQNLASCEEQLGAVFERMESK